MFSIAAYAENSRKLKISDANHPQIYVYMEVDFIELPVARGIISVNTGLVDGDSMRADLGIDLYNNLINVGPPICSNSEIIESFKKHA